MNTNTALQTTDNAPLAIVPDDVSAGALELAIGRGDLSRLSSEDRLKYIGQVCKWVGLNPLTKPIDIMEIKGKTVLYANKSCAEQLRGLKKISTTITSRELTNGVYIVTARAKRPDGQEDESIGAVPIYEKASPEDRANAMMKAETKAKRRVTLSLCGLGFVVDESELDTVKDAKPASVTSDVLQTETASDRAAMLNALDEKPQDSKPELKIVDAEVVKPEPVNEPVQPSAPVQPPVQPPAAPAKPATATVQPAKPGEITGPNGKLTAEATLDVMKIIEEAGEAETLAYLIAKNAITPKAPINELKPDAAKWALRVKAAGVRTKVAEWKAKQRSQQPDQ